ncbi:MAG: 4-oxalomesaconate tautomerase [Altererythrobacter sp.]|nr:4-oxalomesaconate tautomerase [Altererythrobacter sp.]
MSDGTRVIWMRGGTSKGAFFLAEDVPSEPSERDAFLLRIMGSPDPLQIDGMGGANPLTSKVAIVSKSQRDGVDVDYLFLQVFVDQALVSDAQNCGNMLAGVGPLAIERGLVSPSHDQTKVMIFLENTGQTALATVETPDGSLTYTGDARIDGVPGTSAPIPLEFRETAGSMCGSLLPTGNAVDVIAGLSCTLIDNGMPCIVIAAADVGATGYETVDELEARSDIKEKIEEVRLAAGPLMNLGDVSSKSVPKMMLVAAPQNGGALSVRSFIPHRVHTGIGVFAAVTAATAALIEGTPANDVANIPAGERKTLSVEHPTGETTCVLQTGDGGEIVSSGLLRTARKLMDGRVFA